MDSELSEEFEVKVRNAPRIRAVTEFVREGALSELLYVDDLFLLSKTIEGLRDKFLQSMKAFESKGLKVNLGKTKVMVTSGITKDGLSKS